ncbi:MAG: extracellular solute-binding protein [Patescibacteria group bacterium]|nr:extracellular solute-binding protein [Patescibacteria group bacterium]
MNLNNFTKSQKIIISVAVFIVLFFILVFLGVIPGLNKNGGYGGTGRQITLNFWGVDSYDIVKPLLESYNKIHQNTRINYQQINEKNYEITLLNSLAKNSGPDVFMFHRSWLPKHGDKIIPVSDSQFPYINLRQLYPDVIEKDFASNRQVYALPLYLDSLALFYNKDIFNTKGIAVNPTTWNDFKNLIPYFTDLDLNHQIKKSAAGIGGSAKSIENASDILELLMLQYGSDFTPSPGGKIFFNDKAIGALNLYLQFSNPASQYYTWSDNFGNALNTFSTGDSAMFFGYARQMAAIRQKNPYLNYSIMPVPQINPSRPVNIADYWGLAVSQQSKNSQAAWDFIINSTADSQTSLLYLKSAGESPALKSLINQYYKDLDLNIFAKQALTANSVYQYNRENFGKSVSNMIESIINGKLSPQRALQQAEAEINSD